MLLLTGCGGCGPTVTEMRLCEKVKAGQCPEPFTMFVRNQRVLYFSAMPDGLKAGVPVNIDLQYQPAPGVSKSILKAAGKTAAEDKPFAVAMRPRRLAIGRYALKVTSPEENFRERTLRFDVFRTRREIRERLKLGDKNGTDFNKVHVCPAPKGKGKTCKQDFAVIPSGTRLFMLYYDVDDALENSGLTIEWRSMRGPRGVNKLMATSRPKFKEAGGHRGWATFGYKGRTWPRGDYRVIVTASKSKAAPIIKDFKVK